MSSGDEQNTTPICTVDPYEYMQIKLNSDGTITRFLDVLSTPATPDPSSPKDVLSQDFPLNTTHKTYVRMFLPNLVLSTNSKLPIIVYYHGGGFVLLHADTFFHHAFCMELASHAPAIVVSVDYRLAPEHRLPAAYEDAVDALHWIKTSLANKENEWLSKFGDFDNCFLMGTSAGGNIAYHAALRALGIVGDLQPLRFKGLILHHPFFGGSDRTGSELSLINDSFLPLSGSDLFWELGLPVGADRDHEYCNPFVKNISESSLLKRFVDVGLQVLITDCSGDPLVDRLKEFFKLLQENGVSVKAHFTQGDHHGVEIIDPTKRESLFNVIQNFVNSYVNAN